VIRAKQRLAQEGRRGGGGRAYGHNVDGTVRDDEAEVIREAAEAILSGVGIRGVARELNARGVEPVRAKRWTLATLRSLLQQPRLAGLASWNGELIEGVKTWCEPILERGQWEAVRAVLRDPGRRVTPGPTPKYLLSHLALCGHELHPDEDRPTLVHGWSGSRGRRVASYRCATRSSHLSCASTVLDDHVTRQVIDKLSQPDAAELLAPRVEVDAAGLATKANSLRTRLSELGDLVESGDMPAGEYRRRKARLCDELARIEAEMSAAAGTSPLVGIAGRKDASEVWAQLDLGRKKAVIDVLMTVVVLPAQRRGREFDPDRVRIDWR
jgi:site-specific DNA recombinase